MCSLHRKRIVLRRDRKLSGGGLNIFGIARFHKIGLLNHLPRVSEKLHAFARENNAAVRALKNSNPAFAFKILYRNR